MMLAPFFYKPLVTGKRVEELAEMAIEEWNRNYSEGKIVDGRQMITFYCISVLSEVIFGYAISKEKMKEIYTNWNTALECFTKTMGENADDSDIERMGDACQRIEDSFYKLIREWNNGGIGYNNNGILSHMLKNSVNEEIIVKNIKGLFMAGFETISGALSWLFADLAENPEWQKKIKNQVLQEDFKVDTDEGTIKQCYDETVRLHPPLVFIDRAMKKEIQVGEYYLPKDSEVLICPYVVHRDERYWQKALAFRPERVEIKKYIEDKSYKYFPYGGGMMKCMGEKMSVLERNALLKAVLSKYQFEIAEGCSIEEDNALVLRPKLLMLQLKKDDDNE